MHGSYCSLNGSRSKSRKLGATLNRMHMGRRAITAILALLLAASSRLVSTASNPQQQSVRAQHSKPAGQDTHNPLEKIAVHNTALRLDNGIQIQVNSTTLTESGQWFEVSWSGVVKPRFDDWIALYVPAHADPSQTSPAKYKLCALDADHIFHGRGKMSFRLISYRQDMAFAFMRQAFTTPVLAAWGPTIGVARPNAPLQPRLALVGSDPSRMQLQWSTANSSRPTVRWGSAPGQYSREAPARSFSYRRDQLCGPPATTVGWVQPGLQHVAIIDRLVPGQQYYYSYGDPEGGWAQGSFRAAPPLGPGTTVKILSVADMGQGELDGSMEQSEMLPSVNTTRRMQQEGEEYQLLLHNGDISYARGYVTQWDNFFHQLAPLSSRIPYMTAPGNHERDWPGSGDKYNWGYDSGGECGVPYETLTSMPSPGRDQPWYSFDYGPIHFVQYSTEHAFAPGSPQYSFMVDDIRSVNRSVTPWLIVGGHRPMYVSSNNVMLPDGDQTVAQELRAAFEELYQQYAVDLTLHGHHHSYQRTCPMRDGACAGVSEDGSANGTVHLVIGHAGAGLTENVEAQPAAHWEVIRLWWGYLRLQVSGTELRAEVVSDADGSLMDSFVLVKPEGWGDRFMAEMVRQGQGQGQGQGLQGQVVTGVSR